MKKLAISRVMPYGARAGHLGFTLIELMVAITMGMLVIAALLALYLNITRTNSEMAKANRQIENGRFAIQVLQKDIAHAGFWGGHVPAHDDLSLADGELTAAQLDELKDANACMDPASWDDTFKRYLLGIPVRSFQEADSAPSECNLSSALDDSNVLIVSYANTCASGASGCDGGTDTGPHIQVSGCESELSATPPTLFVIDSTSFPLKKLGCAAVAERRKIVSNIYYVGKSNDQPSLMRVSLSNGKYSSPQPLIEGIELLRVEFLVDRKSETGADVDYTQSVKWADPKKKVTPINRGDGAPDGDCYGSGCTVDDLMNVVAVRVHVLARNLEPTPGYKDSKTYQLGDTDAVGPFDDNYKRHVFSTTVRLNNVSGRRETP